MCDFKIFYIIKNLFFSSKLNITLFFYIINSIFLILNIKDCKLIIIYNLLNNDFLDNLFLKITTDIRTSNIIVVGSFAPVSRFFLPSFVVSIVLLVFSSLLSSYVYNFSDINSKLFSLSLDRYTKYFNLYYVSFFS